MTNNCRAVPERICPACNSVAGLSQGEKNGFQILCCENCGTLYTSRLPDVNSRANCDRSHGSESLFVPEFMHARMESIVASFSAYRHRNRFLEIGFGAATLLQAAARAGWYVEGVETSRTLVRHARESGVNAFHGELHEARYPDCFFDVVAASEVLEHVPDPQFLVREIARVLRPGGLFWGTTPHGRGVAARLTGLRWVDVCPPSHLQLFSLRALQALFIKAGFQRIKLITEGANPVDLWRTLWRGDKTYGEKGVNGENMGDRQPTETWTKSLPRRAVKGAGNALLRMTHLGDSLRFRAEK